jgi:hypothetical protein
MSFATHIDKPGGHYVKWKKGHRNRNTTWSHFYVHYKLKEVGNRVVVEA